MLSSIVGQVDWNAAAVLCVAFITTCVIITTFVGIRRSKRELEMQFQIDKQKLHNEDEANKRQSQANLEYKLAEIATSRDVQFKRIDSGLIEGTKN